MCDALSASTELMATESATVWSCFQASASANVKTSRGSYLNSAVGEIWIGQRPAVSVRTHGRGVRRRHRSAWRVGREVLRGHASLGASSAIAAAAYLMVPAGRPDSTIRFVVSWRYANMRAICRSMNRPATHWPSAPSGGA